MAVLLKIALVRVSFIQIMQVRVQNKGKSVWKSRYVGDVLDQHPARLPLYPWGVGLYKPLETPMQRVDLIEV